MIWNYQCPNCSSGRSCDWLKRNVVYTCGKCFQSYTPPTPAEQHSADVDTHNWPIEMEDVVVELKGDICTVPGCNNQYETLDHRIPYTNNGPTSVSNLFPMCNHHNQSKGDTNYYDWLESID